MIINMETVNLWVLFVTCALLVGIANGQGRCHICNKSDKTENCNQQVYYPSYDINEELCVSLAKDDSLEKNVCVDFPNGYQLFCVQAVTESEFTCRVSCPPPKVIQERFYGGGGTLISADITLISILTGSLVLLMRMLRTW